mgnify:CR=1 FL=1
MAIIDIIILVAFGLGAIIGFMKGFVKQLASLLGLIVGLLAAKALYASLAVKLCPTLTDSMTVAQVLAFVLIWLAVPLLFSLVASLLTRAMEAVSLGWLNHWLGAGLGGFEVPPVDEPADWCHRIYRRRQYADWQNKKERISVILSYGRVCRDILSRGKGGYGADCKRRL